MIVCAGNAVAAHQFLLRLFAVVGFALLLCSCAQQPTGVSDDPPFFVDRSAERGIDFRHQTDPPGSYFMPEIMGSGCALLDFDRDGDLDVLLVNLGTGYSSGTTNPVTHRLYEQVEQNRFVDVSERAGLVGRGLGMGVAVGDVNNDGWPDVYLSSFGPDQMFLNRGNGQFVDVTESAGIENLRWGSSACFFDFDRDGWLDLFVSNYLDYADRACTRVGGGQREYCGPQLFPGTSAKLFRNLTGERPRPDDSMSANESSLAFVRFQDVSLESGIASQSGPGLGAAAADFTGDGWPDLYVANDQTANFLWINQRDGTFREEAILRGCAYDAQGKAQASMGVAVGDPDGEFDFDLFVTHLDGERSTLYLNQSEGDFVDATVAARLGSVTLPFTGFGTAFADLDLDGDEDLVIGNGRVKRPDSAGSDGRKTSPAPANPSTNSRPDFWLPYRQHGQILINDGSCRFQEVVSPKDDLLRALEISRGLATGDIDNDGDIDLLVNRIGARAALFINEAPRKGNWVRVKVVDPKFGGRDVYGATVTIVAGDKRWIRCLQPGTSYQSSNDPRLHFGIGKFERLQHIEITWPDGTQSKFPVTEVNCEYRIERSR